MTQNETITQLDQPRARTLRIRAADVRARLDAGERLVFLDARCDKDREASGEQVRGSVRTGPATPEPGQMIVIYCACPAEAMSAWVARQMREQGFSEAFALRGGLAAWRDGGGACEPLPDR